MGENVALGLGACVAVVPGNEVFVACEGSLDDDLAGEDDARVGLAVEFPDEDCGDGGCDEEDPEHPAPANTLGKETTADGAEDGAEERSESVDGGGSATLFGGEEVANDTTTNGQTAGATDAG